MEDSLELSLDFSDVDSGKRKLEESEGSSVRAKKQCVIDLVDDDEAIVNGGSGNDDEDEVVFENQEEQRQEERYSEDIFDEENGSDGGGDPSIKDHGNVYDGADEIWEGPSYEDYANRSNNNYDNNSSNNNNTNTNNYRSSNNFNTSTSNISNKNNSGDKIDDDNIDLSRFFVPLSKQAKQGKTLFEKVLPALQSSNQQTPFVAVATVTKSKFTAKNARSDTVWRTSKTGKRVKVPAKYARKVSQPAKKRVAKAAVQPVEEEDFGEGSEEVSGGKMPKEDRKPKVSIVWD
jgi:hypothetical protein